MGFTRLYTGDDGQSHIEELDRAFHPEPTPPQATAGITFWESPPGRFVDWLSAPRRQYVITLSGEVGIGLGDGTARRFGPGQATLAEDVTGPGHTLRGVGRDSRIFVTTPLGD